MRLSSNKVRLLYFSSTNWNYSNYGRNPPIAPLQRQANAEAFQIKKKIRLKSCRFLSSNFTFITAPERPQAPSCRL